MKDLEPHIYRQRLTIEGKYQADITAETISAFLKDFAQFVEMTPLTEPFIFTPNETGHAIHHGVAGFMAWAESGCSIYTWDKFNFLSVEIYTCKKFDNAKAAQYVKDYFNCSEIESQDLTYGAN
jgi:S-adenosylmethionine decarboxylase